MTLFIRLLFLFVTVICSLFLRSDILIYIGGDKKNIFLLDIEYNCCYFCCELKQRRNGMKISATVSLDLGLMTELKKISDITGQSISSLINGSLRELVSLPGGADEITTYLQILESCKGDESEVRKIYRTSGGGK